MADNDLRAVEASRSAQAGRAGGPARPDLAARSDDAPRPADLARSAETSRSADAPASADLASLGSRPWLVLGGGGVKGLAHVGVWRRLEEAGAAVAGVVGCSIGAVVGACIASGMDADGMARVAKGLRRADIIRLNRRAAWISGIKAVSVFRGDALRDYIKRIVPAREWSELRFPLLANAVELETGRTEWFGPGARTDVPLVDALYASAALPVLYPPMEHDGMFYVDGGLDQVVPVDRAVAAGATGVVAVDVVGTGSWTGAQVVREGMVAIHQRAMGIMIRNRRRTLESMWGATPTVHIEPNLEGYGTFDFGAIPYFLEEGYRAAGEAVG